MIPLTRRDPLRDMRERMDDVFNTFRDFEQQIPRISAIPVDIEETGNRVIVTADLPGVEKENIEVSTSEDAVAIRAQHEEDVEEEQKDYYRRERSSRRYNREITLPSFVDPDSAEAKYENGVLTITLEKVEEEGKRRVDVK